MEPNFDRRRVVIFLAVAFGMAWATGLVIYLTGGLENSPPLIPGVPGVTLALVLLAVPYMWAPAIAHILTRIVTREGWQDARLRPHFAKGWRWWIAGWLLPPVLIVLGSVVYFAVLPQYFDPTMSTYSQAISAAMDQAGTPMQELPFSVGTLVLIQLGASLITTPLINSLFTFGEEFGWRAYLQPKLMALGPRRALALMGLIWGMWHWPVIFMGYEYGFEYPGAPYLGPLTFVWIALMLGTILGWLSLKGRSVWPAVLGHAMFNGFAGAAAFFTQGEPNPLLGPLPVGVLATIPMALLTLWIFLSPRALAVPEEAAASADEHGELVAKAA